jgi:hypothetical protein
LTLSPFAGEGDSAKLSGERGAAGLRSSSQTALTDKTDEDTEIKDDFELSALTRSEEPTGDCGGLLCRKLGHALKECRENVASKPLIGLDLKRRRYTAQRHSVLSCDLVEYREYSPLSLLVGRDVWILQRRRAKNLRHFFLVLCN